MTPSIVAGMYYKHAGFCYALCPCPCTWHSCHFCELFLVGASFKLCSNFCLFLAGWYIECTSKSVCKKVAGFEVILEEWLAVLRPVYALFLDVSEECSCGY